MKRIAHEKLDEAGLFIPKRPRYGGVNPRVATAAAATTTPSGDALLEGSDVPSDTLESLAQLEQRRENIIVTCYLAMNLYLQPKNVYGVALYWITQYVNYAKRSEVAWFQDHVERLLRCPASLSITSSRGVSHAQSRQVKHTLLLRFAGSELHRVPNEYFLVQRNQLLTECLIHLTERDNDAFVVRRLYGLKGEAEFDFFRYDRVLQYFYEPALFVLASYIVYCNQLFDACGARDMSDFAPVLRRIVAPLRALPYDPLCLCKENTNYAAKRLALHDDMAQLARTLEQGRSPEAITEALGAQWQEVATRCASLDATRFMHIYNLVSSSSSHK